MVGAAARTLHTCMLYMFSGLTLLSLARVVLAATAFGKTSDPVHEVSK